MKTYLFNIKIGIAVLSISILMGELLSLIVGWSFKKLVLITQGIVIFDSLSESVVFQDTKCNG